MVQAIVLVLWVRSTFWTSWGQMKKQPQEKISLYWKGNRNWSCGLKSQLVASYLYLFLYLLFLLYYQFFGLLNFLPAYFLHKIIIFHNYNYVIFGLMNQNIYFGYYKYLMLVIFHLYFNKLCRFASRFQEVLSMCLEFLRTLLYGLLVYLSTECIYLGSLTF